MWKHEWWCNIAMKNSHSDISTRKDSIAVFGLVLLSMKNEVSKSPWIIIGLFQKLLIKCLTGIATQHPQGRSSGEAT